MNVNEVKTVTDFEKYVAWLEQQNFDTEKDYELYNQAFENAYGHPAFDENGNFWKENK